MSRRLLIRVHRWLALTIGVHWLLLAITGMLLVFHREIETSWVGAGTPVDASLNVSRAILRVENTAGESVRTVIIQDRPVRALRLFAGERIYTVDASSQEILSITLAQGNATRSGVVRFSYELHHRLLSGRLGEIIVGLSGAFLLLSASVGISMVRPRSSSWKNLLLPRPRGKRWEKHYIVHRSIGFLASIGIAVATISGMGMVWASTLNKLVEAPHFENVVRPIDSDARKSDPLTADQAIDIAQNAIANSTFVRVDLPSSGSPHFEVRLREPGEIRTAFGASVVRIDANMGEIVSTQRATQQPMGRRILSAMFSFHNGEWLGLVGRLLVFAAGGSIIYLFMSGIYIWYCRLSKRSGHSRVRTQ